MAATATAAATGTKLRGRHSKSSSSIAKRTAARGASKTAAMPAAAPAQSSVLRSSALRFRSWAPIEPKAPPVMMIGPSAPNGPPVPIAIAEAIGFKSATRGCTLLPEVRTESIASGMPWPRIFSEPKRATRPITSPPQTGARRIRNGEWPVALGATRAVPKRW
jgi:hypothetical protein